MYKTLPVLFFIISLTAKGQNDRLHDRNMIAWPQLHLTIPVGEKTDLLAEYQWRRTGGFTNWQQSLLRGAIQYRLNEKVSIAAGYGWIETFVYGDYPIASNGNFPEHRLYEQVQLKNSLKKLSIAQRLRMEQRWLGRRAATVDRRIEEWLFSHRFRYLLRLQHPLSKDERFYVAAADEIFIGAGKNVGVNIFDQNRLMLLMGFKINDDVSFEAGYLSQTLVQARRINNHTILQDNRGLMLVANIRL